MNAVRLLFSVYNFIFLVIGGVLLGLGIWISTDNSFTGKLKELLDSIENIGEANDTLVNLVSQSGYILIGFGCLIFLLSFLGYCGAVKESRFLLGFYSLLLALILLLEVLAVLLTLTLFGPRLEAETRKILLQNIDDNYKVREDGFTELGFAGVLNGIMLKFNCCGINNGSDFVVYKQMTSSIVPPPCCESQNMVEVQNCQRKPTELNSYFNQGCYYKLKEELFSEGRKTLVLIVGIVIGLLQVLGIMFAIFTYKNAY